MEMQSYVDDRNGVNADSGVSSCAISGSSESTDGLLVVCGRSSECSE